MTTNAGTTNNSSATQIQNSGGVFAVMKGGGRSSGSHDAFVMKLAIIASMSGLLFGYDTGVVSGAVIFIRGYMDLNNLQVEVVVASTVLAAAISAALGGHMMDSMGRKRTLTIASLIFVLGSLVMALAFGPKRGYIVLVIGRIIVGVAIGLASDAGPLYISECAPPNLRGSLTTLFNVAVVGGQVFASIVCGLFSYLPPSYNWRLMLGFGAVPALLQMLGFFLLPLSPTWLVLQGREIEAEEVLRKIRMEPKTVVRMSSDVETSSEDAGDDDDEPPADHVLHELNEIIEENEMAKKYQHVGLIRLWRFNPPIRRAMLLGCSLWAVSQLAGINTIMYYGAGIVRRAGLDGDKSFDIWITVPLYFMQLVGIFVCFAIIDRKGRRFTLLLSMFFVLVSLVLIGLGFTVNNAVLTVFAMCFYLFAFGVGLSTMPYTINSEIYPVEYRGACVAQATGVFWITNFAVSMTFLTLYNALGDGGVFYLYASIVMVSGVAFYFLVPETSGLSLHEIQALFEVDKSPEDRSLSPPDSDGEGEYGSTANNRGKPKLKRKSLELI